MRSVKVNVLRFIGVAVVLASVWAGGLATAQCITTAGSPLDRGTLGFLEPADVIVIAIDNSGSVMANAFLPTEKECAKAVVQIWEGKQFAVLSFNSSITVEQSPTYDTAKVFEAIDRIQDTENWTWMNGAIDKACEIIREAGERGEAALVLATDGFPTTPDGSTPDLEVAIEATRQAAENFRYNCSILAVIGVALEQDAKAFLEEISNSLIEILPPPVDEDFETCDFSRLPWETGGDADWFVTRHEARSGQCSAQAGKIDDYESTYLELTIETGTSVSFSYKVSSEEGCDSLCFYVDHQEMDCWSGEIDYWRRAGFLVHPGTHTLRWEYRKDSSYSYGQDTAWIDYIASSGALGEVSLKVKLETTGGFIFPVMINDEWYELWPWGQPVDISKRLIERGFTPGEEVTMWYTDEVPPFTITLECEPELQVISEEYVRRAPQLPNHWPEMEGKEIKFRIERNTTCTLKGEK